MVDIDIIRAINDPRIIGDTLSAAQEAALRAQYGLPLDAVQAELYQLATGRNVYEPREYREGLYICGRRSGKSSKLASNVAVFEACFRKHELAAGERGWVVIIAATRRQAAICFQYVLARLENSPTLRRLIASEPLADEVHLTNGVSIGVWSCNFRSIRGLSILACVADECSFWTDLETSANPTAEVLRAVRPGMSAFPQAKLILITSPFAKSGVVWEYWRDREKHPDRLCWKLGTRQMNPALSAEFLDAEELRDPESFAREYGAEFYESASAFLPADSIEVCVVVGRFEGLPQPGVHYTAAIDVAFRGDAFAHSIVHRAGEKVIEDYCRSWRGSRSRPVPLSETLAEIVANLRRYGVGKVFGDSFCSEPIRQALKAQGVEFVQAHTLGAKASQVWNTLRTLITSR